MIGFSPNLAGMILRGWGFKGPQMVPLAPLGAQGEGHKGPKVGDFQTSSSLDPEIVWLSHCVCRYLYM